MEVLTRCSHCVGKIKQLQFIRLMANGPLWICTYFLYPSVPHCRKLHISKLFKPRCSGIYNRQDAEWNRIPCRFQTGTLLRRANLYYDYMFIFIYVYVFCVHHQMCGVTSEAKRRH